MYNYYLLGGGAESSSSVVPSCGEPVDASLTVLDEDTVLTALAVLCSSVTLLRSLTQSEVMVIALKLTSLVKSSLTPDAVEIECVVLKVVMSSDVT